MEKGQRRYWINNDLLLSKESAGHKSYPGARLRVYHYIDQLSFNDIKPPVLMKTNTIIHLKVVMNFHCCTVFLIFSIIYQHIFNNICNLPNRNNYNIIV